VVDYKLKKVTFSKKGEVTMAKEYYSDGSTREVPVTQGVVDYIVKGNNWENRKEDI